MSKWDSFIDESEGKYDLGSAVKMLKEDEPAVLMTENVTFMDDVKRYLSLTKIKRAFNLGTELFGAAAPFLEKPTWWNAGKATLAMGKVLVEDVEFWADDYFGTDDWIEPYSADFNATLLHVLQRFPYERIKTMEDNTFVRICKLPNGVRAGWTYTGRMQTVEHIYVETDRLEEARACIKQLLWEQFKEKSLVMRKNTRIILNNDEARVIFEVDNAFECKLSKRAVDYSEYLKKPLDAGVSRSVMFYGPPGTGKSTLARTIIDLMNLRSFRIRIADLGGLDNSTLFEAIKIFEPDAVILDDFDRAHGQAQLLETLEFFQQKVRLVIVTVNDRSELDDALMRPGRIDELLLVDKMDEEVVKHVLGDYAEEYELVKDWPVSFVIEWVKRRTYMAPEDAKKSLKELMQRVNDLNKYRDDNDTSRMMKVMNKSKRRGKKVQPSYPVFDQHIADDEIPDEVDTDPFLPGDDEDA